MESGREYFWRQYSPSNANTILLQAVTTLIRPETDTANSTTNTHTSTNAALTNTVSNRLRTVSIDLTSATGSINSVAVSPGDMLKIALSRGTDTDTDDLRFIAFATEVTFT